MVISGNSLRESYLRGWRVGKERVRFLAHPPPSERVSLHAISELFIAVDFPVVYYGMLTSLLFKSVTDNVPPFQPMRNSNETRDIHRLFPRFSPFSCICIELCLLGKGVGRDGSWVLISFGKPAKTALCKLLAFTQ